MTPDTIKQIWGMGYEGALFMLMGITIKALVETVKSKDEQLDSEREKREVLIREQILNSKSVLDATEKISDALVRIEGKIK